MTSSYRNRAVPTTANRDARVIADLKNRRQEEVTGMRQQAQGQINEMNRLSGLQAKEDIYELEKLKHLSNSVNEFVQKAAVPFVKQKWEEAIDRGRLYYNTRDTDPTFDNLNKQVDAQLDAQEKLERDTKELAEKATLEVDKERIRSLSHFERMGWNRARLEEAAAGFGNHRMAQLAENTTELTLLGEDGKPYTFRLNEYSNDKEYEAASQHIYREYVMANKGDFSEAYIGAKFIPLLEETENKQKTQYYHDLRLERAREGITNLDRQLMTAWTSGNVDQITSMIQTTKIGQTGYFKTIGPKGGANQAWRKNLISKYKEWLEVADPSHEQAAIVRQAIANTVIKDHPSGPKKLGDLYPGELDEKSLRLDYLKAKYQMEQTEKLGYKAEAEATIQDAPNKIKAMIDEGGGVELTKIEKEELRESFASLQGAINDPKLITEYDKLLNMKKLTPAETTIHLQKLLQLGNGEIGESTLKAYELTENVYLDQATIDDYRQMGKVVDNPFFDSEAQAAALKHIGNGKSAGSLEKIIRYTQKDLNDTNNILGFDADIVLKDMKRELHTRARNLYNAARSDGNLTYSKEQAYNEALGEINLRMKTIQETDERGHLWYNNGDGFPNAQGGLSSAGAASLKLEKTLNIASKMVDDHGFNALLEKPIATLTPGHFRIDSSTNYKPQAIFYKLARQDGRHTALEIYNAQAGLTGFSKEIPLDATTNELNERVKRSPVVLRQNYLKNPGSKKFKSQLMAALGIFDKDKLKESLFESDYHEQGQGWAIPGVMDKSGRSLVFSNPDASQSALKLLLEPGGNFNPNDIIRTRLAPINGTSYAPNSMVVEEATTTYRYLLENGESHGWVHLGDGTFQYVPEEDPASIESLGQTPEEIENRRIQAQSAELQAQLQQRLKI